MNFFETRVINSSNRVQFLNFGLRVHDRDLFCFIPYISKFFFYSSRFSSIVYLNCSLFLLTIVLEIHRMV